MPHLEPVILFFLLGVLAGFVRSDPRIPGVLYESLSIFLLLAIGLGARTPPSASRGCAMYRPPAPSARRCADNCAMVLFVADVEMLRPEKF